MVSDERMGVPPSVSPTNWQSADPPWRHFDNSVNAVSFGFVATAILISMFLVMAVFERFIRPPPPSPTYEARGNHLRMGSVARGDLDWKLAAAPPSPKEIPVYAREVSVLMPGENLPTFIAQPAPTPYPPEHIQWRLHQHQHVQISSSSQITTANAT